jgi:fructose-bisphosphate aldolase class I
MKTSLSEIAQKMVAPGKGILAADESHGTITKRFAALGIESTEDSRRRYREMYFTAEACAETISGVILYDETIRQSTSDGVPFPEYLSEKGIVPGIKVDTGAKSLAHHENEKITEGLDGLRERLVEYHQLGGRFAKWRAVITIGDGIPSRACIEANAHALARYAALCQEAEIVPIVEPEVLMDGGHSIDRCQAVTETTLVEVFDQLHSQGVFLEGMVLKPNMVISATDAAQRAGVEEVAERTLETLRRCVPAAVPGIAFLSGGQSDQDATAHLNAMNRRGPHPWELTFSYGRALQAAAMRTWSGKQGNLAAAAAAFGHRARMNSAARSGNYEASMEAAGARSS